MESLEKENKDLRMRVKELEESFETRMKTVTNDKESEVDALKQKVEILEETLQLQTTRLDEKVVSVVVESNELPTAKLNAEEPEVLDISNCVNYSCDKCDFYFDEEDALDTHNELYHENRCDICDVEFEEEDALITHKEIYHENKCDICDYESTTEKGLKIHKGRTHKEKSDAYSCDKCGLQFLSKDNFNEHNKTMHRAFLTF